MAFGTVSLCVVGCFLAYRFWLCFPFVFLLVAILFYAYYVISIFYLFVTMTCRLHVPCPGT